MAFSLKDDVRKFLLSEEGNVSKEALLRLGVFSLMAASFAHPVKATTFSKTCTYTCSTAIEGQITVTAGLNADIDTGGGLCGGNCGDADGRIAGAYDSVTYSGTPSNDYVSSDVWGPGITSSPPSPAAGEHVHVFGVKIKGGKAHSHSNSLSLTKGASFDEGGGTSIKGSHSHSLSEICGGRATVVVDCDGGNPEPVYLFCAGDSTRGTAVARIN